MPREYMHVKRREAEILRLREAGRTRQEIADEMGLTKEQIKGWVKRYNRRQAEKEEVKVPKARGRKSAVTLAEYKNENKRLQMENELLRDFLQLAGRR